MSAKQKEAVVSFNLSTKFAAISAVFDQLPTRFKMLDLFKIAGIKDHPRSRSACAIVLYRDFKCVNVGSGCWKKP